MSGEATSVGSIVAYLRMDDSDWKRTIAAAKADAASLGRSDPRVKISTNSTEVIAQLGAVNAATSKLDGGLAKTDASARKASGGVGLLVGAVLALGPALLPIAAVGVGAMAGLAATGGTALLVIKGVSTEMKNGTQIGQQYRAGLNVLNGEFLHLQHLAAAGALPGFNAGLRAMQPLFPTLNRDVALFSGQLGQIVGHTAPGLVSLFHGLNPLFTTFGGLLVSGSAKFQAWAASSDSVGKFVAYVETELPNVLHTIGALITTVSHLGMAFAPLGGTTVTLLGLLATAINAIPINVLTTLAPIVTTTVLAFKGFSVLDGLSGKVGGLASKLTGLGEGASGIAGVVGGASTALKGLGVVGLAAGPIIGLLVSYLGQQKAAQAAAKQTTDDYTQALIASNLAIDANVRASVAKSVADTNAFRDARQLGVTQGQLIDLITGQGDATNTVLPGLRALAGTYADMTRTNSGFNGQLTAGQQAQLDNAAAAKDLLSVLGLQTTGFDNATGAAKNQLAAISQVSHAEGESAAQTKANAAAMGLTAEAYVVGVAAAKKNADATAKQTEAMRFSNDAAGLLKMSLDALNGVTLDVSAAQTASASAYLSLTAAIKQNGNTTALNTDKGVANRQAVESAVRANQAYAEAESKKTTSGVAASKMLTDQRTAFIRNIEQTYGANSAIAVYTRSLYGVPKAVTTKTDAQTAAANAKLDALKVKVYGATAARTVTIYADTSSAIAALQSFVNEASAAQAAAQAVGSVTQSAQHAPSAKPPGRAAGGSLPEGYSTINEQGWELLHKQGSDVQVIPHALAKKMLPQGPSVPAFAGGTGGITHGSMGYEYNGIWYSTERAALNAQTRDQAKKPKTTSTPATITASAGGGSVYGVASYIREQLPNAKLAARDLALAVDDAFQLKGVRAKLASVRTQLADLRTAANTLQGNVTSNLGSFDPTKYGDFTNLLDTYKNKTSSNSQFTSEISKLSKLGLSKDLLNQYASAGPSAGLDMLAGLSKGQIAQLNKVSGTFDASARGGGLVAENAVYGSQVRAAQRQADQLTAQAAKYESAAVSLLAAVGKMTNRPAEIKIDGKTIAHVVIGSGQFQGVIDDITNKLLYGRKKR